MEVGVQPGSLVPPNINLTYGNIPGVQTPDNPRIETCTHINTQYDIVSAAVCMLYIKFGILYVLFGKFLFSN